MKTFDIAVKYLKDIDLSIYDTYDNTEIQENNPTSKQIKVQHEKFKADKNNNVSNDYYRNMTFAACLCHMTDLAHKRTSYWDVACTIIESDINILKTPYKGFTDGSIYPKIMVDKFEKYCNEMNPQPLFLSKESEVKIEFFMAAFHYMTESKC